MEAENFTTEVPGSQALFGHVWTNDPNPPNGFSGPGAMITTPNSVAGSGTGYDIIAPLLNYSVQFSTPGTYYFWVRMRGVDWGSDSIHVGLNGTKVSSGENISVVGTNTYIWSNRRSIVIPTSGIHDLSVWMREDGAVIDKIVMTTDSSLPKPTGTGPTESQTTGTCGEAPVITAGCFNTFQATALNGTLMATDPDPISFSLDANNPMIANGVSANGAMITLNTITGDYTYTPNPAGPRGLDTFQFRVDDPTDFSIGTETVIVNPKVMPLGDSITLGVGGDVVANPALAIPAVSYRLELLNRLNTSNLPIEYVGELSSGSGAGLLPVGQRAHAGYSACQDFEIASGTANDCFNFIPPMTLTGIFDELEQNPADVVLLHIGTNPPVTDPDANDLGMILSEIRRWEVSANGNPIAVTVMQIINRLDRDQEANIMSFNSNVITLINTATAANLPTLPIIRGANVDMFTLFGGTTPIAALFADNLHPSQVGYDLIGSTLFSAITTDANRPSILQGCP